MTKSGRVLLITSGSVTSIVFKAPLQLYFYILWNHSQLSFTYGYAVFGQNKKKSCVVFKT